MGSVWAGHFRQQNETAPMTGKIPPCQSVDEP